MKFTDTKIRSLLPAEKKYYLRAANGFSIRVLPSGAKTWLFIYTQEGKRKEMNLGHYPSVTLEEARRRYRDAFTVFENGKDPAAIERVMAEERRKAPLVEDLVREYIEKHAKRFKRSWAKDEAILNRDIVPAWGKRKAEDIAKRDVILLLEKIIERGSPGMANNCFQIVRKMFNFAVERDILPHTPCVGVKLPSPRIARDRVLSEEEIKNLWESLDKANLAEETRKAIKLVLITAQRPGEVAGMHVSEIDGRWWTIPAERAKNGKAHRVYLTDLALELIGNIEGKDFVFPCPHKSKQQPLGGNAMVVAIRRNLATLKTEYFTPHDLRRTAATFLAEMGTMDEVIDAILNHAKMGVIRVYNQYRYDREKQQALESWERKLKTIITGRNAGKVVALYRA
jgi:integrase